MNVEKFRENLGLEKLPADLVALIDFQNKSSGFECYSECFGVLIDKNRSGIRSWSKDEQFLSRLYPFAQANGSGSLYAIWDDGSGRLLNEMPVVVFGDEGGVHLVAENLLQLLHLLSFDVEISVDFDGASFYENKEDCEESEDLDKYLKWLKERYGLEPVKKPNAVVKAAQKQYGKQFKSWFGQFYKDE